MAEQTERSFLKQPVFLSSKLSKKGKAPGKSGTRFWKNIGQGFKTPREAIEGRDGIQRQVVRLRFSRGANFPTDKPEWNSKQNIVFEADGPRMVRTSVFETNRFSKNNLVGYCDLDLSTIFDDRDHAKEVHELYDPNYGVSKVMGKITLGYDAQSMFF